MTSVENININTNTMNAHEENERAVQKKTFRFKFSENIQDKVAYFADIHKHDDRVTFKEEWETWVEQNKNDIRQETERLENMGYDGDVVDKMFKSARYYFKKKTPKSVNDEPVSRRQYISISKDLIKNMDTHVQKNMNNDNYKPSVGYEGFIGDFEEQISNERDRILNNYDISPEDLENKFKKTYKNRYFNVVKNM